MWFRSASEEKPFVVATDQEKARAIARHLYDEVEVAFRFVRDDDEAIRDGVLEEFWPVDASPAEVEQWRAWFLEGGGHWDDVEDVNLKLGRGDGE